MRNIPTLLRRELGAYFTSVVGYISIMIFLLVMGLFFAMVVTQLVEGGTGAEYTVMQGWFFFSWVPMLFIVPAITMRLLAEEKRAGTIEMLMTAPVTDHELVVAKFLGALTLYAIMWALTSVYVVILRAFSSGATGLDIGPIWGGYVCMLLIGQFLIAIGLLASALTRNQLIAFITSFVLICVFVFAQFMLPDILAGLRWISRYQAAQAVQYVAMFEHIQDFARGIIDLRPIVLYLSGTVLVLFIAIRVVESRKWR